MLISVHLSHRKGRRLRDPRGQTVCRCEPRRPPLSRTPSRPRRTKLSAPPPWPDQPLAWTTSWRGGRRRSCTAGSVFATWSRAEQISWLSRPAPSPCLYCRISACASAPGSPHPGQLQRKKSMPAWVRINFLLMLHITSYSVMCIETLFFFVINLCS